jgi:large subunit ribosomal protein L10
MKTRETKQKDLELLTESLQKSTSAMVVSFSKLSVSKDQEFRNRIREAGAEYRVVKNTLARIAVKGTQFEPATEAFKGVTAIAWTQNDPVILSKAISKFVKDNADTYTFKAGVLDGRLLDLKQVTDIASLPSKEELISKLLYVLNAQAQRIVTVINAVPRDLAIVIKQIGEKDPAERGGGAATGSPADGTPEAEPSANASSSDAPPENQGTDDAAAETVASSADENATATNTETQSEGADQAADDRSEEVIGGAPAAEGDQSA